MSKFSCPKCLVSYPLKKIELVGKRVRCPNCEQAFTVALDPTINDTGISLEKTLPDAVADSQGVGTRVCPKCKKTFNDGPIPVCPHCTMDAQIAKYDPKEFEKKLQAARENFGIG